MTPASATQRRCGSPLPRIHALRGSSALLSVIAWVEDPLVIEKILTHIQRRDATGASPNASAGLGEQCVGVTARSLGHVLHAAGRIPTSRAALTAVVGVGRDVRVLAVRTVQGDEDFRHDLVAVRLEAHGQPIAVQFDFLDLDRVELVVLLAVLVVARLVVARVQIGEQRTIGDTTRDAASLAIEVVAVADRSNIPVVPNPLHRRCPVSLAVLAFVFVTQIRRCVDTLKHVAALAGLGSELFVGQDLVKLASWQVTQLDADIGYGNSSA